MTNNNMLTLAIGGLGIVMIAAFTAIVLLRPGDNTLVLASLAGLAVLFVPQLMNLKTSAENAERIKQVDHALAAVAVQQSVALEEQSQTLKKVESNVDGNLSGMREEQRASNVMIATLMTQVASLEKDKAVKQNEQAHQETIADKLLVAMPAAVAAAIAATPLGTPIADVETTMPPGQARVGDKS